jgi:hypothetical protein
MADLFDMLNEADASDSQEAAANMNTQPPAIQPTEEYPTTPSTPQQPAPTSPLETREISVLDRVADVGKGIVSGAEGAVIGARKTVRAIGRAVLPESLQDEAIQEKNDSQITAHADQPETVLGKVTADIMKFGLGFVGGRGMLTAAKISTKLPGVIREIVESGVGTAIVADPNEKRLSNILQEYPFLENPVSEFLAAKEDDGLAEGKFKAAMEDMLTTPVAMVLFKSLKLMKNGLMGKGASKELDTTVDDIAKSIDELDASAGKAPEKFADNIIEVPEVKVTADAPEPTQLFRGSKNGEAGDFWTPDEAVAKNYAGEGGHVAKEDVTFKNLLEAPNWMEAKKALGLPQSATMPELITAAKNAGHDGVTFKTTNGPEFIRITQKNDAPATDVGASPEVLAKAADDMASEAFAKNSKGDVIFALKPDQKAAFTKALEGQVVQHRLDNLLTPMQGAFNYSKMDSQVEVKTTLDALANILKPALDKNVGDKQTFGQINSLASLIGSKPEQLVANLRSWGVEDKMMASTVVAAKNWMQSIGDDIFRLSDSIYTGAGGNSAKMEMLRMMDILADVEGMTKSLQKAAARTTAAGRIRTSAKYSGADMKKMLDAYGGPEALDKLAERLALAGKEPDKLLKVVQASGFRKFVDSHNELWINGILSGFKTHAINVISTAANTLAQPLNMIVGGTVRREWADVREGVAIYRGLRQMIGDSFEMSRRAFATEKPVLGANQILEHPQSISSANYNLDSNSWLGWGVDALGKAVRMPGRFLGAEDEFFKQMNYRAKLMAQASREASDMVKNGKLDPKKMVEVFEDGVSKKISEVDKYIHDRFQGGFEYQALTKDSGRKLRPGESIGDNGVKLRQTFGNDEDALRYAEEATFTQDLKTQTWFGNRSFSETLQTAANTHPLLRGLVIPFIRVPANLTRQVFDYTPVVGQLHKRYWADIAAGGTRKSVAIGKLSMGSMFWTGAMFMAMEGGITGRAPGDKEMRERKLESGWQPYSFPIGPEGNQTYVSFQRLDPFGMVLGLAADFSQLANQVDDNQRHSLAMTMTLALAENLSSKSYLKGLVEISSLMGSGYAKEDIFQRMLNMRAGSYVPSWMSAFRPDDEMKNVRTAMDAIMAKIPGLSETVEARRDYFGEKKEYPMQWPYSAINPFTISEDKPDPVRKELARLASSEVQSQFSLPREKHGTLDLSTYKNAKGQTAYDRWIELIGTVKVGGRTFHDKLGDLFKSERYKLANDGTSVYHTGKRPTMIHVEQERYRSAALKEMLREFDQEGRSGKLPFNLSDMVHTDQKNMKRVERAKTPTELLRDLQ